MPRLFLILVVCLFAAIPLHAATFTVLNTADSGADSLREAISNANATAAADVIEFQIPGAGPHTIGLASNLPDVTSPLVIDGFSQSGSSQNTSSAGFNSVLQIELDCNQFQGFLFTGAASGSVVRGIAIGDCTAGIVILGGVTMTVGGTYVGTDATGTLQRQNGTGVFVQGSGNQIGIAGEPAARNLISGNGTGVQIQGPNNVVVGNLIGTTASGNSARPNGTGIGIAGAAADGTTVTNNVISGNSVRGVLISGGSGNVVSQCLIGVAIDASTAVPNTNGILVTNDLSDAAINTTITNNIIRFNTADGILLFENDNSGSARTPPIRTTGTPAVNAPPTGTRIDDNEIRDNGELGIDIQDNGVSLNDVNDADAGANSVQNFPVITTAIASGGSISVAGTLQSLANTSFDVQLFVNDACDPSGHGEGSIFLGELTVTTDASGNASFSDSFSSASTTGVITATATENASGNTSEFSACQAIVAPANSALSVMDANIVEGNAGTSLVTVTVTLSPASATPVQVNFATSDGTATSPSDYTPVNGTLTFPAGTTTQTFTIPIVGDLVVEADETIHVTLSSPSNATIDDGSGTVTINNDDAAAPVVAAVPTLTEIGLMLFAAAIALLAFLRLR